jgi:hypothetical protein
VIDGVTVHDTAERRSGIVTFTVAGVEPDTVVDIADRHEITINASTAPWAALDMDAKELVRSCAPHRTTSTPRANSNVSSRRRPARMISPRMCCPSRGRSHGDRSRSSTDRRSLDPARPASGRSGRGTLDQRLVSQG